VLRLAFVPLGGGSSSIENQTSIYCLSPAAPAQKIEFVISCQSRNNSPKSLSICSWNTGRAAKLRRRATRLFRGKLNTSHLMPTQETGS